MNNKYIIIILNISLVIIFPVFFRPAFVYGQDVSTTSPTPTNSTEITVTPVLSDSPSVTPEIIANENIASSSAGPIEVRETEVIPSKSQVHPTLSLSVNQENNNQVSANFKKPLKIIGLEKTGFLANEKIETRIVNGANAKINTELKYNGKIIPFAINRKNDIDDLLISLDSPRKFNPGKYSLEISADGNLNTQDFSWGNLNLNFNKSIYMVNETSSIGITVADDQGSPVCNANLEIKITSPATDGISDISYLSTSDRTIIPNHSCRSHAVDIKPDYEGIFQFNRAGIWKLEVTAVSGKIAYKISDTLKVVTDLPFNIERKIPSRIYSPEKYPALIKITANQDFTGEVRETVPEDLTVIAPLQGQKFDKVSLDLLEEESSTVSGRINLGNPFTGIRTLTQGFGDNETDPVLARQYRLFGTLGHDGIDFGVPENTPVLAADSGFILYADWNPYGKTLIIKHSWGQSYYGHLSSFTVLPNQFVSKGDIVAFSGSTGLSTGPHLHFGMRLNNFDLENGYFGKVDPLLYLNNSTILSGNFSKNIIWNLSLKKGESVDLGYMLSAPDIPANAYKIGPLKLKADDPAGDFSENREFQILTDSLPVKFIDAKSGTIDSGDDLEKISTDEDVEASFNRLYLAVVSSKPDLEIAEVEGLGLNWQQVSKTCKSKTDTGLNIFWAIGTGGEDGKVTVHFSKNSASSASAAISVYSYSGTDPQNPIGNIFCDSQDTDTSDIAVKAKTSQENSLIYSAISGNSILNPGELFNLRNQVKSGITGRSVSFYSLDKAAGKITDDLLITADFEKPSVWNLLGVELVADQNKPKNRLRHGMWFNNQGSKQPFNL